MRSTPSSEDVRELERHLREALDDLEHLPNIPAVRALREQASACAVALARPSGEVSQEVSPEALAVVLSHAVDLGFALEDVASTVISSSVMQTRCVVNEDAGGTERANEVALNALRERFGYSFEIEKNAHLGALGEQSHRLGERDTVPEYVEFGDEE